ncbi:MAG: DUF933 domain-containing protein [Planctomycetaceae bacterium]
MKLGLVGYQGTGKSTVFQLLTGVAPDAAKVQSGQVGVAIIPDSRFDRLLDYYKPKKIAPAKVELFDTPGLDRRRPENNAQRLSVIRESAALIQVVGVFAGEDPQTEISSFSDELVLADLQIVANRIERLKKDVVKPRPDREELQLELDALLPLVDVLQAGNSLMDFELTEPQEKAVQSFALLTRKNRLVVLNTADSSYPIEQIPAAEAVDCAVIAAPMGLELELQALPDDERDMFAEELGLTESSRDRLLRTIFEVTDRITFYTSCEKEVHAWLLKRGATVLQAADSIHSDLSRGFVRAEIWSADDLLRLGSERELKAQGLNHVEGKEYVVQDGDEIFVRSGI